MSRLSKHCLRSKVRMRKMLEEIARREIEEHLDFLYFGEEGEMDDLDWEDDFYDDEPSDVSDYDSDYDSDPDLYYDWDYDWDYDWEVSSRAYTLIQGVQRQPGSWYEDEEKVKHLLVKDNDDSLYMANTVTGKLSYWGRA